MRVSWRMYPYPFSDELSDAQASRAVVRTIRGRKRRMWLLLELAGGILDALAKGHRHGCDYKKGWHRSTFRLGRYS